MQYSYHPTCRVVPEANSAAEAEGRAGSKTGPEPLVHTGTLPGSSRPRTAGKPGTGTALP